jgi:phage pi2 protein 07
MDGINIPAETPTLNQLELEIKFYLNQTAQNILEVGKRLTQAKAMVQHGEWQNWLKDNFNLSKSTANNFMRCAERFSNFQTSGNLNPSQMVEMLSLPAGEEEKFIAEKAAEGTPVEDMTVKKLREEVAKYKANCDAEKAKVENLFEELAQAKKTNAGLKDTLNGTRKVLDKRTIQVNELEQKLKNQKPVEVLPADYEANKRKIAELSNKISQLQQQANEKTVEVVTPADYDETKKELERLQAEQSDMVQRMDVFQKLDRIADLINAIVVSPSLEGVQDYMKEHSDKFCGMYADFQDFFEQKFVKDFLDDN